MEIQISNKECVKGYKTDKGYYFLKETKDGKPLNKINGCITRSLTSQFKYPVVIICRDGTYVDGSCYDLSLNKIVAGPLYDSKDVLTDELIQTLIKYNLKKHTVIYDPEIIRKNPSYITKFSFDIPPMIYNSVVAKNGYYFYNIGAFKDMNHISNEIDIVNQIMRDFTKRNIIEMIEELNILYNTIPNMKSFPDMQDIHREISKEVRNSLKSIVS